MSRPSPTSAGTRRRGSRPPVAALTPWAADHPFAFGELRPRRVQLDGYVRGDGHAWRVPPEVVGQAVFVQRTRARGLRVLRGDTVLVEHRRPAFPHEG